MIYVAFYKLITEYIIGTEIHWRSRIGPGLIVYHGYGLVVHSDVVIGSHVVLRQGVTIGSKVVGGELRAPKIGDYVDFGAGSIALGDIVIGDHAVIGAGSVVTRDVPPATTVVGNPARPIQIKQVPKPASGMEVER